jgi:tetratricopeptide (TPR) repeat protein
MKRMLTRVLHSAVLAVGLPALAADLPAEPIQWSGQDVAGQQVSVPAQDSPTVMVFLRPGQAQSAQLLRELPRVLKNGPKAHVLLVVSGPQAAAQAAQLSSVEGGSVVSDPDFELSGRLHVHAWPTTVVLDGHGQAKAHLPGLPKSYQNDLRAYVEHASGRIDAAELEQQLGTRRMVEDQDAPGRRLQLVEQLLHRGRDDEARDALVEGLETLPDEPALRLRAARLLIDAGEPDRALSLIEQLEPGCVPGWQVQVVQARALIATEQWEQADAVLRTATRLNPNPSEAYYLLGRVQQHGGDWQAAAESFRRAYESSQSGQRPAAPQP